MADAQPLGEGETGVFTPSKGEVAINVNAEAFASDANGPTPDELGAAPLFLLLLDDLIPMTKKYPFLGPGKT